MELVFITRWLPESFSKFGSKPLQRVVFTVTNSTSANSLHVETLKCMIDKNYLLSLINIKYCTYQCLMLGFFFTSDQHIGSNV
jgi:hypothetical protein